MGGGGGKKGKREREGEGVGLGQLPLRNSFLSQTFPPVTVASCHYRGNWHRTEYVPMVSVSASALALTYLVTLFSAGSKRQKNTMANPIANLLKPTLTEQMACNKVSK